MASWHCETRTTFTACKILIWICTLNLQAVTVLLVAASFVFLVVKWRRRGHRQMGGATGGGAASNLEGESQPLYEETETAAAAAGAAARDFRSDQQPFSTNSVPFPPHSLDNEDEGVARANFGASSTPSTVATAPAKAAKDSGSLAPLSFDVNPVGPLLSRGGGVHGAVSGEGNLAFCQCKAHPKTTGAFCGICGKRRIPSVQ
jgi:hypothetical protein